MLHKGEEWNLLIKVPRFKLWPEHGRKLRLDGDAESNKCIVREDGRIGKSAARSRTQAKTIIRQVVENMIRTEEIRLRVTNGRLVVNSQ